MATNVAKDRDRYLSIAPHFSLHHVGEYSYLLLSENQSYRLRGDGYSLILPYLDGRFRLSDIIAALSLQMAESEIVDLVSNMRTKGYVVAIDPWGDHARSAFWSARSWQPDDCEDMVKSTRIAVVPVGGDGAAGSVKASDFAAMLMAQGFTLSDMDSAHLTIVLVDDYLQPALAEFAAMAVAKKKVWIPFKPGGVSAWFGPLIGNPPDGKHETNCYFCLARRLREHRPGDGLVAATDEGARPARAMTQATLAVAFGRSVLETVNLKFNQSDDVRHSIITWSFDQGETRKHGVPLFDDCPQHAGHVPSTDPATMHRPIKLSAVQNHDGADGGWRVLTPKQALAKLEPIISPISGIVSQITLTSPAEGLHVYSASQGQRMAIDPRQNRSLGKPGGAAGKGLSQEQAKISCLAEAVERYSAQWTGTEPRIQASRAELGDLAPHPHSFLEFAEEQYQNREHLNKTAAIIERVPVRFDENATIDWSAAWSLRDHEPRWLPSRFCYYEYHGDVDGDHEFCWADSNGCATGGSIEEAILQGFLELVERDAISVWWYNQYVPQRVSLAGLDDEYVGKMQAYYKQIGRQVWILDVTTDLGIPVMIAVSSLEDGSRVLSGFGAHLDGRVAALRALTELNQILLLDAGVEAAPKSDVAAGTMEDSLIHWLSNETLDGHPYLVGRGPEKPVSELPESRFDTIDRAVQFCVDRVAEHGMDTIVLDLGRSDLPLSCVRVVVPGLRHFWNRRGPGRLYEAPVKMGVLERPHRFDDLNPISFFL